MTRVRGLEKLPIRGQCGAHLWPTVDGRRWVGASPEHGRSLRRPRPLSHGKKLRWGPPVRVHAASNAMATSHRGSLPSQATRATQNLSCAHCALEPAARTSLRSMLGGPSPAWNPACYCRQSRAFGLAASGQLSWPYGESAPISYWPPVGIFRWPPTDSKEDYRYAACATLASKSSNALRGSKKL